MVGWAELASPASRIAIGYTASKLTQAQPVIGREWAQAAGVRGGNTLLDEFQMVFAHHGNRFTFFTQSRYGCFDGGFFRGI